MTYFEGDLVVPRDVGDRYCPSRIVVAERRHHDQSRTRRSETDDMLSDLLFQRLGDGLLQFDFNSTALRTFDDTRYTTVGLPVCVGRDCCTAA